MSETPGRREFLSRAPEARAALVAELGPLVARGPFSEDEAALILHVLAHAGYGESGHLFIPSCAALWGEEPSYLPVVALPKERARDAARLLLRRGVLRAFEDGVHLEHERVRELSAR